MGIYISSPNQLKISRHTAVIVKELFILLPLVTDGYFINRMFFFLSLIFLVCLNWFTIGVVSVDGSKTIFKYTK